MQPAHADAILDGTTGDLVSGGGFYCLHTLERIYGLRPGVWKVNVVATPPLSCNQDIKAGDNWLNFTEGKPSCGAGLSFP